jgi:hypothetical protein
MRPPKILSRRGIKQAFPRVSEASWDAFFDYEKHNGLHRMRVQGPNKYAHYDVEQIMDWLMCHGHYHPRDFYEYGEMLYEPRPGLQVRTHVLAG